MIRFRILMPGIMLLIASLACSMATEASSHVPRPTSTTMVIQSAAIPTATIAATVTSSPTQQAAGLSGSTTTNYSTTRTCTPPSGWVVYRVVSGDTLSVIAERIGTTTNALVAANCLANASRIDVGQALYVPSLPPAASSSQSAGVSNYLQVIAIGNLPGPAVQSTGCTLPIHLFVGGYGRYAPRAPVNVAVYPSPGYTSAPMVSVTDSDIFVVLAGPQCLAGVNWWQITFSGVTGWIVEGDANGYFVEPTIPGQNCTAPFLTVGSQGQPVPGANNDMYTGPSAHTGGTYLGEVPDGTVFTVVAGPTCAENVNWWQVSYNAITGWIMETQNGNALVTRYP